MSEALDATLEFVECFLCTVLRAAGIFQDSEYTSQKLWGRNTRTSAEDVHLETVAMLSSSSVLLPYLTMVASGVVSAIVKECFHGVSVVFAWNSGHHEEIVLLAPLTLVSFVRDTYLSKDPDIARDFVQLLLVTEKEVAERFALMRCLPATVIDWRIDILSLEKKDGEVLAGLTVRGLFHSPQVPSVQTSNESPLPTALAEPPRQPTERIVAEKGNMQVVRISH